MHGGTVLRKTTQRSKRRTIKKKKNDDRQPKRIGDERKIRMRT